MRNVTAGFGKYNLEDIGQEFKAIATPTEMDYDYYYDYDKQ